MKKENHLISCKNLYVSYGREDVLHNVSLEIDEGAFIPFIGPNGAGKTTLLRVILGILKPRKGSVITPFKKQIPGYVPQHKVIDPLYPVSVKQIVMMGLYPEIGWWRKPDIVQIKRVEYALERFGLADHTQKTFSELSGGMKQKTLLARAFVTKAQVYVLDEPTSDLDESSEEQVINHLYRMSKEEGKTVLMALHGAELIRELVPSVCLIQQGKAMTVATDRI